MDRARFEKLVEEALADLPKEFADRLDNIAIAVQDFATPEQLARVNLKNPHQLLGLYEGIALTNRPLGYSGALPDRITIFRVPIEEMSRTDEDIKTHVRKTVMHELGHYFGMSEAQLEDI